MSDSSFEEKGRDVEAHLKNGVQVDTVTVLEKSDLNESVKELVLDTVEAEHEYTDAQFKRLRMKIDLCLIPIMWASYGLMQADKSSISTQATFGIRTDTHLVGQQFNWLSTIFYLSFLIFELPGNLLMQRVQVGKTLGTAMTLWGIIVLCVMFAKNFADLMVIRFFQGALECTIAPAFLIITGSFYTVREHTLRVILWGTAGFSFSVVSDLCNYGIALHAQNHPGGLAAWKGISAFLGSFTIFMGILVFFFLGTPREVWWLSADEKRMATARVVSNQTGTDRQKRAQWQWNEVAEAFRDPQVYFLFFSALVNALPNGAINTFSNLVFTSFGFTPLETLVKGTVPRNLIGFVMFVGFGFLILYKSGLRFYVMMGSLIPTIIGMFLLAFYPTTSSTLWVKWGFFIMTVPGSVSGLLIQTFIPSNVSGRTKKTVCYTVVFIAYCAGNATGAQVMQATDAPRYLKGITVCACMYGVEFSLFFGWRLYYFFENRRRARAQAVAGVSEEERARLGKINAEMGMTDRENEHFRYDY